MATLQLTRSGTLSTRLDLQGIVLHARERHTTLAGSGWTLEIPWEAVASAYRVHDRDRVAAWFQEPGGDTLMHIEGVV
jgi:hypothetical protein